MESDSSSILFTLSHLFSRRRHCKGRNVVSAELGVDGVLREDEVKC
jgi:hypothetical protein